VDEEEFDDPDRPLEDREDPEDNEEEDDDEVELGECPKCGMEIYEDAVRCPLCGEYIGRPSNSMLVGRPWWFVLLALLGVLAVLYASVMW
jgi:predicted RNA-binding Zn-ribbon protein involved in translation (DUF1610 family)